MSLTLRDGAPAAPRTATRLLHGLSGEGVPDPGLRTHLDRWGELHHRPHRLDRRTRGERARRPRRGLVPRGGQVAGGRRGLAPAPGRGGERGRRRTRQPQGRVAALAHAASGARRPRAGGDHLARPAGHRVRPGLEHSDCRGRTRRAPCSPPSIRSRSNSSSHPKRSSPDRSQLSSTLSADGGAQCLPLSG